jgi:hypothetical protein
VPSPWACKRCDEAVVSPEDASQDAPGDARTGEDARLGEDALLGEDAYEPIEKERGEPVRNWWLRLYIMAGFVLK